VNDLRAFVRKAQRKGFKPDIDDVGCCRQQGAWRNTLFALFRLHPCTFPVIPAFARWSGGPVVPNGFARLVRGVEPGLLAEGRGYG
jgi:hypothetical protein